MSSSFLSSHTMKNERNFVYAEVNYGHAFLKLYILIKWYPKTHDLSHLVRNLWRSHPKNQWLVSACHFVMQICNEKLYILVTWEVAILLGIPSITCTYQVLSKNIWFKGYYFKSLDLTLKKHITWSAPIIFLCNPTTKNRRYWTDGRLDFAYSYLKSLLLIQCFPKTYDLTYIGLYLGKSHIKNHSLVCE